MKPFSSSDSFEASTIYQSNQKSPKSKQLEGRDFHTMIYRLEEEDEDWREDDGVITQVAEKKRRLTVDQVMALQKNFEVENRVEPERKVKLAEELGLQPRQIAVWFQNRRARLKGKDLERDYGILKANYDVLKLDYNNLEQENAALTAQLRDLKAAKLCQEDEEISHAVEKEDPVSEQSKNHTSSSVISNDAHHLLISPASSSSHHQPMNWVQFSELGKVYQQPPQPVKLEEQRQLLNLEDSCNNFFSVDQAPTLQWYFTTQ